MIKIINDFFHLETQNTAYIFSKSLSGLLLHHYYGKKITICDYQSVMQKLDGGQGTSNLYEGINNAFIDVMDLEISAFGKGDYREAMISLSNENRGYTNNFKYIGYEMVSEKQEDLPMSYGADQTLRIDLFDSSLRIRLELYYKVFERSDVICKYAKVINESQETYIIHRLMSSQLDLKNTHPIMMTFDGAWSTERHLNEKLLTSGITINDSKHGVSSNKHNPLFILRQQQTTEDSGEAYGFNLVYSGNHAGILEVTPNERIRILQGINPATFEWKLKPNDVFCAPEALLTYTHNGLNQLSHQMHDFVNNHIVRGLWKNKKRPVLINNWEATYFNFNEKKLLELAKKASQVGIELFVLDDGWFGKRNNDKTSLGDWFVNSQKLPHGLGYLCDQINQMKMMFGLWVEPEMINEESELYRLHPEYAIRLPDQKPSLGRNQMVLDLTNPNARDNLVQQLSAIFSSCNIEYVKWDFNRNLTDLFGSTLSNQKEFLHRYMMGLYDVLSRLTSRFPHILFESCASGGNRFDLGMLCFMPQIWTSDDTDYNERLAIQTGTSYGYPLSTMGAHVSDIPNHQTLRNTSLSSRFNLASFGVLGYELDLTSLSNDELEQVKSQISFYKEQRKLYQYGRFYRSHPTIFTSNRTTFYCVDSIQNQAIVGFFQSLIHPNQSEDVLFVKGLHDQTLYQLKTKTQKVNIEIFGGLINLILPIRIKLNGKIHRLICKLYQMKGEQDDCLVYGEQLRYGGIRLTQQFMGTGFNDRVRVLGDFGSRLYIIKPFVKKEYKLKKQSK